MKKILQDGFFLAIFFFVLLPSRVFALDAVLFNENILSQKVSNEINLIGKELYQKSNIFIGVMVGDKTEIETLLNKQNPEIVELIEDPGIKKYIACLKKNQFLKYYFNL